jgi:hypothetical protein
MAKNDGNLGRWKKDTDRRPVRHLHLRAGLQLEHSQLIPRHRRGGEILAQGDHHAPPVDGAI